MALKVLIDGFLIKIFNVFKVKNAAWFFEMSGPVCAAVKNSNNSNHDNGYTSKNEF